MSALGQKQTYAAQKAMSASPPRATAKADIRKRSCPLYPRKRTLVKRAAMSRFVPKSDRWRRDRYLIRSAAHPLGRGQKLKRLAVLRQDIVFRATGHFFLQAVP